MPSDLKDKDTGVQQVEDGRTTELESKEAVAYAATQGQAVTGYETLTLWETFKTFKVATAFCLAAPFRAATDGYQIG